MTTKTLRALLCPQCKTLSLEGWEEIHTETNRYKIFMDKSNKFLEYSAPESIDRDLVLTRHYCPDASFDDQFTTEDWEADAFLVLTVWKNNKLIEIKPLEDHYFNYYTEHPEELPKVEEVRYDPEEFEPYLQPTKRKSVKMKMRT